MQLFKLDDFRAYDIEVESQPFGSHRIEPTKALSKYNG